MTRVIRKADAADAPGVSACVHAAYAPYVARIGTPPGPMLDDYAAVIREHDVHVVDGDGRIAGVVVLVRRGERLLLDNIAVHPRDRGERLGHALLVFAEQRARERGHRALELYTHVQMSENIAWYARRGYAETARVNEKGFARVYMRKPLG